MGLLKIEDISWDILPSGSIRGRKEIDGKQFSVSLKPSGRREDEVKRIITKKIEKKYDAYKESGSTTTGWNTLHWIETWLTSYKMPKDSEMEEEKVKRKRKGGRVTRSTYSRMLRSLKQIKNYASGKEILRKKLSDVSTVMIQRLIHDMENDDLAASTVKKVKNLLGGAFDQALQLGYIGKNPILNVKCQPDASYVGMREDLILQMEDFPVFINEALSLKESGEVKYTYGAAVALQALTGCREGELLALSWDCVDFKNKIIRIEHSVSDVPKLEKNGVVTTGKSERFLSHAKSVASNREIPFTEGDFIEKSLLMLKDRFESLSKQEGFAPKRPLVAGTATGNYLTANYYNIELKRIFKAAFPERGDHISSHKLRHSFISLLVNDKNVDIASVASIVGHGDLRTTLGYASHTNVEKKRNTIGLVSKMP